MQVVVLIWTDGKWRVPLGIRIWRKGGKSKLKLAEELLWEARRRGLSPIYVLFDSWYGGESLLNLLASFGWQYITKAKRNRLFDKVQRGRNLSASLRQTNRKLKEDSTFRVDCQRRQEILFDE